MNTIPLRRKYERVIQIELNEISRVVIDILVKRDLLPNFAKINREWTFLQTKSESEYHQIEPWIQWLTVHTGEAFAEHRIFHLGDGINIKNKQIWEVLSENNIESAVTFCMNARPGQTKGGIFIPDPWSQCDKTCPPHLKSLWKIIARGVQGHATRPLGFFELIRGIGTVLWLKLPLRIYGRIIKQFIIQKVRRLTRWKLASIFDDFLWEIFRRIIKTTDFGFYAIFLNSVAHYQHHYWRNFDKSCFDPTIKYFDLDDKSDPMTYGYKAYDRIVGEAIKLAKEKDALVIIVSGLTQVPFTRDEEQGGMNFYRLKNHKQFAKKVGLDGMSVYPLMSRDWQVVTNNKTYLDQAYKVLSGLNIKGRPLFRIDRNTPQSLFMETAITQRVGEKDVIQHKDGRVVGRFFDFFTCTALRSGHHSGEGYLWYSEPPTPALPKSPECVPLSSVYTMNLTALLGVSQQPRDN